jgi:hypothetical protein
MVEFTEMIAMPRKYFTESSNYLDIGIIFLTFITLYLPKENIWNPQRFGFLDNISDEILERGCAVKRCISALVLVLVFCRFLGSLSQSPGFKQYNLYLIMFNKVMKRYVKVMSWFVNYIVGFGLGFYIMFHHDTERMDKSHDNKKPSNDTPCCCKDDDKSKFDHPLLALTKTWTMFIGELDFDDLDINGGDLSTVMAYLFLIAFIFLVVIVVMNLLNGLAVSDIQNMMADSKIESQISIIETIRYLERVYFTARRLNCIEKLPVCFPTQSPIFGLCGPLQDMKLSLPLSETDTIKKLYGEEYEEENQKSVFYKIKCWFSKEPANYGSEDFLDSTRKILIRLWKAKDQKRRQDELRKQIKKLSVSKKIENEGSDAEIMNSEVLDRQKLERLKDEILKDQLRNIETMLKRLLSDSSEN